MVEAAERLDHIADPGEKIPYPGLLVIPPMEPLEDPEDLGRKILVPRETFERILEEIDWTWQQVSRGEFPDFIPGKTAEERMMNFQLAIIQEDPHLWCTAFLREPEDPDHQDPYQFFDYQLHSLHNHGSVVHQDGAEVGKTREIVAWTLWKNFTVREGSGLIGAPLQIHLDEIINAKIKQLDWNPVLYKGLKRPHKKQPYTKFEFSTNFEEDYRPSGHDGNAYRGVHVRTFAIKDEAAKDKNPKTWSEFWRAVKPGCSARIYSVPDGDRETEYFKLTMQAESTWPPSDREATRVDAEDLGKLCSDMPKEMLFTRYRWSKKMMPHPYWSPERKKFFIKRYGPEDSPEYRHNVDGEHGDPENPVFPWHHLKHCIVDVPEFRCLKILVDTTQQEVLVEGYRCDYVIGNEGPTPRHVTLRDESYPLSTFFDYDDAGMTEFKRLIRAFFLPVPGLKRGGGDFGYSPDPTELTIWNIIGKRERLVARLQLKSVTYDQQCQALDAMDDIYGQNQAELSWGTDFGNAGSAVAHVLQGEPRYANKNYDDRLSGFMFQSTTENINEDGEEILDGKSGKPAKITLKEMATDHMVGKVQRQETEMPADSDLITAYTNHTCRAGERQRIYNKKNDHVIDSHRAQRLRGVMGEVVEDFFSV